VIESVLDADYAGIVVRDRWAPSRQLTNAEHQTGTAGWLHRGHKILEPAYGRPREISLAVERASLGALAVRARRGRGELDAVAVQYQLRGLEARMTAPLDRPRITPPANRALLKHLRGEFAALFMLRLHSDVNATNWRTDPLIQPAVVNRKVWGVNRARRGARIRGVLMSGMQTGHQRQANIVGFLTDRQRQILFVPPILVSTPDG